MRLFAGIPVGGEIGTALAAFLRQWRAEPWPVRWVRDDGLHLTVKFYGEVAPEPAAALSAALEQATRGTPILPLQLGGIGAFPSLARAHVLWAGLEAPPALELLVDRIERASAELGYDLEGRPFRPHVTLGRLRDNARLPLEAVRQLERVSPEGNFVADRLVLYQSRPGPGGSTYHPHATFPLGS